jgi:predicted nucleic acid-binding protein
VIFVDTGAWFASVVPTDADHAAASQWLAQNREALITTDYVVDETLTLLRARGQAPRAIQLGEHLFGGKLASLYYLSPSDIMEAWQVFRQFADKEWSFTDCCSKVVIEKPHLPTAFAFDQHFRQFGSVTVVPR